ncbi:MAG: Gmad2 immunoglobulin-like domain-containing protein [Bacillota bacterium]|nr:Gmad2 immunoglobulin-like domain-containing protein [Bacillota bacterium]
MRNRSLFWILLMIFIIATILIGGCRLLEGTNNAVPQSPSKVSPEVPEQFQEMVITREDIPSEVLQWFDSFGTEQIALVYQHPYQTYLNISSGNDREILMVDAKLEDYEKIFVFDFVGSEQAGALSNRLYLNINSDLISNYRLMTSADEELVVEQQVVFAVLEQPRAGDVINSPVEIQGRIAAFEGSFVVRIIDNQENIIAEEYFQTDGAPAWGQFTELVTFDMPVTEPGRIEVGEYSAKDGEYLMRAQKEVNFDQNQ